MTSWRGMYASATVASIVCVLTVCIMGAHAVGTEVVLDPINGVPGAACCLENRCKYLQDALGCAPAFLSISIENPPVPITSMVTFAQKSQVVISGDGGKSYHFTCNAHTAFSFLESDEITFMNLNMTGCPFPNSVLFDLSQSFVNLRGVTVEGASGQDGAIARLYESTLDARGSSFSAISGSDGGAGAVIYANASSLVQLFGVEITNVDISVKQGDFFGGIIAAFGSNLEVIDLIIRDVSLSFPTDVVNVYGGLIFTSNNPVHLVNVSISNVQYDWVQNPPVITGGVAYVSDTWNPVLLKDWIVDDVLLRGNVYGGVLAVTSEIAPCVTTLDGAIIKNIMFDRYSSRGSGAGESIIHGGVIFVSMQLPSPQNLLVISSSWISALSDASSEPQNMAGTVTVRGAVICGGGSQGLSAQVEFDDTGSKFFAGEWSSDVDLQGAFAHCQNFLIMNKVNWFMLEGFIYNPYFSNGAGCVCSAVHPWTYETIMGEGECWLGMCVEPKWTGPGPEKGGLSSLGLAIDSGGCHSCPASMHLAPPRDACIDCPEGTYYSGENATFNIDCWTCPSGQVPDSNQVTCVPDSSGYLLLFAAESAPIIFRGEDVWLEVMAEYSPFSGTIDENPLEWEWAWIDEPLFPLHEPKSSCLFIPAFTLPLGYSGKFSLEVSAWPFEEGREMQTALEVTVTVQRGDFRAVISPGGVWAEAVPIVLDAFSSYDKDTGGYDELWRYSWACLWKGEWIEMGTLPKIEIGASSGLPFLIPLPFSLNATTVDGRRTSDQATITLLESSGEMFIFSLKAPVVVNSQDVVSVFAVYEDCSNPSFLYASPDVDLQDPEIVISKVGSEVLLLRSGAVAPGSIVRINAQGYCGEKVGSASAVVTVNNAPSVGIFVVEPTTGIAYDTLFALQLVGWVSGTPQLLLYSFAYVSKGGDVLLSKKSTSSTLMTTLPMVNDTGVVVIGYVENSVTGAVNREELLVRIADSQPENIMSLLTEGSLGVNPRLQIRTASVLSHAIKDVLKAEDFKSIVSVVTNASRSAGVLDTSSFSLLVQSLDSFVTSAQNFSGSVDPDSGIRRTNTPIMESHVLLAGALISFLNNTNGVSILESSSGSLLSISTELLRVAISENEKVALGLADGNELHGDVVSSALEIVDDVAEVELKRIYCDEVPWHFASDVLSISMFKSKTDLEMYVGGMLVTIPGHSDCAGLYATYVGENPHPVVVSDPEPDVTYVKCSGMAGFGGVVAVNSSDSGYGPEARVFGVKSIIPDQDDDGKCGPKGEKVISRTAECRFWDEDVQQWSEGGCWRDEEAGNMTFVVCQCSGLGSFAALSAAKDHTRTECAGDESAGGVKWEWIVFPIVGVVAIVLCILVVVVASLLVMSAVSSLGSATGLTGASGAILRLVRKGHHKVSKMPDEERYVELDEEAFERTGSEDIMEGDVGSEVDDEAPAIETMETPLI